MKKYYVYVIECLNGSFYTGYTTNLERRYQEHLTGSLKCKYTRSFPPKRLAATWCVGVDLSIALKTERAIKKLTRAQKQTLINDPESLALLCFNNDKLV